MTHLIIDYSFLYYKYKFALDSGKMKRLYCNMEVNGETVEKDISQIYYSLREIEGFRKELIKQDDMVIVSVCFDMPSDRKHSGSDGAEKYKSNRGKKLNNDDFENINLVKSILDNAGYNTFRIMGYEADDLIHALVNRCANYVDSTVIVTPDADILVNIQPTVEARRYKSRSGYTRVTVENFEDYLSTELKCMIPYNSIMLYKCTVGDKSDCIDGIGGFGPKAFNKLVDYLNTFGIHWEICRDTNAIEKILDKLAETNYLSPSKIQEARESLELVKPKASPAEINEFSLLDNSSDDKRRQAYLPYQMTSLV